MDLPYFKYPFKDLGGEGSFYPIAISLGIVAFLLISGIKFYIPKNNSYKCLILLLSWIVLSGIVNLNNMFVGVFKGGYPWERFLGQTILFIIMVIIAIYIYNLVRLKVIRIELFQKYIIIGFIITAMYSINELLAVKGINWSILFINHVGSYIHRNFIERVPDVFNWRIRSLTQEPSHFAFVCNMIYPWLIAYAFNVRRFRMITYFMTMVLILFIILTFSRTAYIVTLFQSLFLIGICIIKGRIREIKKVIVIIIGFFIALIGTMWLASNITTIDVLISLISPKGSQIFYGSTVSREAIMEAAWKIALENPFFGFGFGQTVFNLVNYLPSWSMDNIEFIMWSIGSNIINRAHTGNIHVRFMIETGLVGFSIWLTFWIFIIQETWNSFNLRCRFSKGLDWQGVSLLMCLIGLFIYGFASDAIDLIPEWILIGLTWGYIFNAKQLMSGRVEH